MKKKKGSSLMIVVMSFTMIMTIGVSLMSLTLASYKKRLVEVNEKRNQYFSEAGIDIAYDIIEKTVDAAVDVSVDAANKKVQDIIEETKEEKWSEYLDADDNIKEDAIKNDFFQQTYQKTYETEIETNIKDNIENGFKYKKDNSEYREKNYDIGLTDSPSVTVTGISKKPDTDNPEMVKFEISLQSEFSTKISDDSEKIKKIISVNYVIGQPEPKPQYAVNSVKLPYNQVWQKAISTDGSILIKGNVTVDGNVYAQGKYDISDSDSDNNIKGVSISKNAAVNINGIIATNGNFKLNNASSANIYGDLYAGNISINGDDATFKTIEKSGDLLGDVYTNNDMEVNGIRSKVDIVGGFFGIEDKNDNDIILGKDKPNVSSSLLVNSEDIDSSDEDSTHITIGKIAMLMGVGYVNTKDKKYQTGESVAVKGNYIAYTSINPLNPPKTIPKVDDEKNPVFDSDGNQVFIDNPNYKYRGDNVNFEYMDPLTFAVSLKDSGDMNVYAKSDYFQEYYSENIDNLDKSGLSLAKNKINLPDTILSIGSTISKGIIQPATYLTEYEEFVKSKKYKFSKAVYDMRGDMKDTSAEYELDYSNYDVNDIKDSCSKTVENQVNFTNMKDENVNVTDKDHPTTKKKYGIYLSKHDNEDFYLVGKSSSAYGDNYMKLYDGDSQILEGGVIICKGKVHLVGQIDNFKGTIISEGGIEVDDDMTKKITYNQEYVANIIAENYNEYFNNLFPFEYDDKGKLDSNEYSIPIPNDTTKTDKPKYNVVTLRKWKIIQ